MYLFEFMSSLKEIPRVILKFGNAKSIDARNAGRELALLETLVCSDCCKDDSIEKYSDPFARFFGAEYIRWFCPMCQEHFDTDLNGNFIQLDANGLRLA